MTGLEEKIKRQENDPAFRELFSAFRRVSFPQKTPAEWMRIENLILSRVPAPRVVRFPLAPRIAYAVAAAVLLFIGVWQWHGKSPAPLASARFTGVAGEVLSSAEEAGGGTRHWRPVLRSQILTAGEVLRTGASGGLSLELEPGTQVRLGANSRLSVAALNEREIRLQLTRGAAWFDVRKRSAEESFSVTTPNGVCRVVGTQFKVEVTPESEPLPVITRLSVLTGEVRFWEKRMPAAYRRVKAGEWLTLSGSRFGELAGIEKIDLLAREMVTLELILRDEILSETADPPAAPASAQETPKVRPAQPPAARSTSAPAPGPEAVPLIAPAPEEAVPAVDPAELALWKANFQGALKRVEAREYRTALVFLESLKAKAGTRLNDRLLALEKIAHCQTGLNNHEQALAALEEMYAAAGAPAQRENLLWEMASIKAVHLNRFAEAARDLEVYLKAYPGGIWSEEACLKLAELERMQGQDSAAAQTCLAFVSRFPSHPQADQALYDAAFLLSQNLNDCLSAVGIYGRFVQEFPSSKFLGSAIFWRADCFSRLGRFAEARVEYNRYLTLFPQGRFREETLERLAKRD